MHLFQCNLLSILIHRPNFHVTCEGRMRLSVTLHDIVAEVCTNESHTCIKRRFLDGRLISYKCQPPREKGVLEL